ncbi:comitin-like [Sphaeramia orbicularis]|uniref:comitin-like n=1 Tax=Sphaeramia orbicularis TaxID=375764 RepID=UPI00117E8245|nr:comitin-like [Sphaeramia orbicularis]
MSKTSISTNQEMRKGDYLLSTNGNYKAVFQEDGNFVIYTWAPMWSTGTCDKGGFRIVLQEDNNLVMYNKAYRAVWASSSYSNETSNRMRLTMTDDGHLVLDRDGVEIWSSPLFDAGVGPVEEKSKATSRTK